jgi:hypothetical protein
VVDLGVDVVTKVFWLIDVELTTGFVVCKGFSVVVVDSVEVWGVV